MHFSIDITFFLFVLISLISVACSDVSSTDNKSNLISKLLKVINSNDVERYTLNKNGLKKINNKQVSFKDIFKNKRLIKRLVPHGYKGSNLEYDKKFKTIYRPLVRVHGKKPMITFEGKESLNKVGKTLPKSGRNVLYKDEELLQPFQLIYPRKITFKSILDDVRSYIRNVDSSADVRRLKYAILEILENHQKDFLRHKFITGSDERASQNSKNFPEYQIKVTEKPKKKWVPEYSYWNYWTYDKSIHQDICKGKLVQLGNVCVETPPH